MSAGPLPAAATAGRGWSRRWRGFSRTDTDTALADRRPASLVRHAARYGPLSALVAMCVVFSFTTDRFASFDNLRAILDGSAVLGVITVGITFVVLLGALDLSIEGVIATCGMTFSLLVLNTRSGLDLGLFAVVPVVLVGALFGYANGALSTRLRVPTFMTTVGMLSIGLGIASVMFGGVQPSIIDPSVSEWATGRWFGLTRMTYVAAVCVVIGTVVQLRTRLGRYAMAIGSAEDVVALSGVNVRKYKTMAFATAGAFYGLAAVMVTAQLGAGVVDSASGQTFSAITAAVVGGTLLSGGQGGVLHSMVGVLIVTVLSNGLVLMDVSPYAQQTVQGIVVIAAVSAATWPLRERLRVVK